MAFYIDGTRTVTREEFDRLYDQAFDYISIERQRLGSKSRDVLWDTLQLEDTQTRRYMLDDYLVGCSAITRLPMLWEDQEEVWMWYRQPTYGETQSGSRSWWYSEDFQKVGREWMDAEGYDKVMVIHNPNSPAAIAVSETWGREWDGRQYFERPVSYSLPEVFGDNWSEWLVVPDTMRVFLISKHN